MLEIHLSIALDGHLFWYLFLWGFQWFILFHFSCLLLYRSQGPMFGFLLQSKASWTPKMVHILTGSDTCFCFFLSHQRDAAVVVSLCTQPKSVNSFKTSMTLMLPPDECQETPQDLNVDFSAQESVRNAHRSFLCIQVGSFAHYTSSEMAWSALHGLIFC